MDPLILVSIAANYSESRSVDPLNVYIIIKEKLLVNADLHSLLAGWYDPRVENF